MMNFTKKIIVALAIAGSLSAGTALAAHTWTPASTSTPWGERFAHSVLMVGNRAWLFGGPTTLQFEGSDAVWVSAPNDLGSWSVVNKEETWVPRGAAASVFFNNRVWVLGGYSESYQNLGDVWRTTSATTTSPTWTQVATSTPWGPRHGAKALSYNGKLWLMGGFNTTAYNDVWSSTDGVTWTQVTANAPWPARRYFGAAVEDGKMWIVGGYGASNNVFNDVWSSTDGATWTQVATSTPWTPRGYHSLTAYDGKLWLMGGSKLFPATYYNDVWVSDDGVTWIEDATSTPWAPRNAHGAVVTPANGKLWIVSGGQTGPGNSYADVWWTSATSTPFTGRTPKEE